jgi:prolyl 4-hydroxylase
MALERISIQRYDANGFFRHHYDWFGRAPRADRISTVNVFLKGVGECTGGGTHFPYLTMPPGAAVGAGTAESEAGGWCRILDCEAAANGVGGVTFLPVPGNAIYWDNVRRDGSGYMETLHAGMPVTSGTKIGLNIWSWAVPEGQASP